MALDPTRGNSESRTLYYDELHFVPKSDKNELWAAQVLYFNKMVSEPYVDREKLEFYRDLEKGKIDEKKYKEFIDPITPDGAGGKAEFFKANWQTCPIYMHLENIKKAQLKKMPINVVVKAADEFSKLKQQEDNDKIIGAQYMRNFLNEINPSFGVRQLREDEDPFAFINQMEQQGQQAQAQAQQGGAQQSPATSNPMDTIEAIKSKIFSNEQLAIYNQYLYKDGVEVAMEIAIKEYIESINKFSQGIKPRIIDDISNVNAHLCRFYTSTTTGRPIIEYKDPGKVKIGPCVKPDLSDNTIWIEEFDVSFGQFVQMAGGELSNEMLKEIFIKNRNFHGVTGDYDGLTTFQRNSAKIRLGYHEFETQNMDVYAEYINGAGNKAFKEEKIDYSPTENAKIKKGAKRVEKHYNVWYSHYYIPLDTLYEVRGTTAFKEQAKYIFKFGPIQDQVREGDDFRYAKSTYCGYRLNTFSFAQIEHSFMPEIVKLWQLFQNDISSSMSDGVIWSNSVINSMMKYIDDGKTGASGKELAAKKMRVLKYLRQTNSAVADFTNELGEEGVQDAKLFEKVTLNSLGTAMERLNIITLLYEMMTKSLGFNEIAEGQSPQPRQNFGGINLAMMASTNATYTMEESIISTYLTLSEGLMYYVKNVVDEGDSDRFKELKDMIGNANTMAAQSIKDIPMHRLNMHMENQMTDEQKKDIIDTATEMAKAQIISPDQVLFLKMIDNVKYAYAILAIWIRFGQKQMADSQQASRQQQRDDQAYASSLKISEVRAAKASELEIKQMQGKLEAQIVQIDNQLKLHGQIITKNLINDHRTQQAIIENHLQQKLLDSEQHHGKPATAAA